MNKQFTEGKWVVINEAYHDDETGHVIGTHRIVQEGFEYSDECDKKIICDVIPYGARFYTDNDTAIANARLIAAAPEMFELLEKLLSGPVLDAESSRKVDQLLNRITTV